MIINWLPSVWTPNQSLFSVKCEILDVELEEGRRSGKLTAMRCILYSFVHFALVS